MRQKTLGQIAFEGHMASFYGLDDDEPPSWTEDITPNCRRDWEASAAAIRAEVIEECAKAVEQRVLRGDRVFNSGKVSLLIDAIRSLKDQP
jgi:hypothetical protein